MEPDDDKTRTHVVLTKGTMVAHYRIIEKIGAGGMGEVYLAEDTELDRKVALKFLPPHLCQDEDCRKRFKREARAAARLSHPNIITVHEVSEYQGRPFFAMQHIEGRSLRDIKSEELDFDRIVGFAIQLCDGLQAAHAAGIAHRDIKPSNIVIDSAGRPQLLDFGLATVQGGEHLTKTGSTLGTVGYMSPEQIEGKETDSRSDLFSLGVVLYELIASRAPFRRDDETATLKAILQDAPEPLARYKSDVPEDLQRIVTKLLEKDPALRYQSAAGVIPDLKRLAPTRTSGIVTEKKRDWWNRYIVPSAVAVLLIMLAYWYFGVRIEDVAESSDRIRLVVLPFENLGDPEDEYFADGITDEITSLISEISDIGVISRTSAYAFKDSNLTVSQIGEALDVQYVLEGTIRWDRSSEPGQVRIIPQLIDTRQDEHLWSDRYERDFVNVFEVQAEIAKQIVSELGISLTSKSPQTIVSARETTPEAYRYYLRGLGHFRNYDHAAAREMLSRAIELDSAFVKAYAFLSMTVAVQYVQQTGVPDAEDRELAKWLAERAIQLQPRAVEAMRAMGGYYRLIEFDYEKALHWLRLALEQDPEDSETHRYLAVLEWNFVNFERAYDHIQHAISLDPENPYLPGNLGIICFHMRKYDEAIAAFEDRLIHNPKGQLLWEWLAWCEWQGSGSISRIGVVVERAHRELPGFFSPIYAMGFPDIYDLMTGNESRVLERRTSLGIAPHGGDTILYLSDRAAALYLVGAVDEARVVADSLRILWLEKTDRQARQAELKSAMVEWPNLDVAGAYAILGDSQGVRAIVDETLSTDPLRKDGLAGSWVTHSCAVLLTMIGDHERAIDVLGEILDAPTGISAAGLAISPYFVPLRDHPRFKALLEKYQKEHGGSH